MKAVVFLALLSLISCNKDTKKKIKPVAQKQEVNELKALNDRLSILSASPLPAKFALQVNGEEIFDLCPEEPEYVQIDRELNTVDMDFRALAPDEKLQIVIMDRGEDCLKTDSIFYVNERVDYNLFEDKWENSRTLYARLNNYPIQKEEDKDRREEQL